MLVATLIHTKRHKCASNLYSLIYIKAIAVGFLWKKIKVTFNRVFNNHCNRHRKCRGRREWAREKIKLAVIRSWVLQIIALYFEWCTACVWCFTLYIHSTYFSSCICTTFISVFIYFTLVVVVAVVRRCDFLSVIVSVINGIFALISLAAYLCCCCFCWLLLLLSDFRFVCLLSLWLVDLLELAWKQSKQTVDVLHIKSDICMCFALLFTFEPHKKAYVCSELYSKVYAHIRECSLNACCMYLLCWKYQMFTINLLLSLCDYNYSI